MKHLITSALCLSLMSSCDTLINQVCSDTINYDGVKLELKRGETLVSIQHDPLYPFPYTGAVKAVVSDTVKHIVWSGHYIDGKWQKESTVELTEHARQVIEADKKLMNIGEQYNEYVINKGN